MLLLAIKDHKIASKSDTVWSRFCPDGFEGGVLRQARPLLRQGAYGQALFAAVGEMGSRIAAAKGVALDFSPRPRRRTPFQTASGIPFVIHRHRGHRFCCLSSSGGAAAVVVAS